ncbi:septum formation initiator [Plantactinospora sonchi]|uniref:Septum formation initiator n=1 Tax=Plantactinospora sonchi TaxID=1544735 RepID=A0ABU7RW15_9ACTN
MRRRTVLAAGGWLLAALAATGTGLAAVQVIGAGLTGPAGEVRTPDEVARALAEVSASPTPSAPAGTVPGTGGTPTGSPTPGGPSTGGSPGSATPATVPPVAGARLLATPGGTIVARCDGGRVWLVSWTPAQGYRAEEVDRGPDDDAEVTFRSTAQRFDVEVECRAGEPVPSWQDKSGDDD